MKLTLALIMTCVLSAGCANGRKSSTSTSLNSGVLDIAPTPPTARATYAPPQPVVYDSPLEIDEAAPSGRSARATAGKPYTVRKGDTLWKIAESHYGSGNKWQQIASANPHMSPDKIKAGDRIVLP